MTLMVVRQVGRKAQGGQALAEMGLVVLLFVLLTCGIVDFGRMLMILNVVTHAARDGARMAAVIPDGSLIAESSNISTRVQSQIATVTTDPFTVTTTCAVLAGGPAMTVEVRATNGVDYLFTFPGLWGGTLNVDRSATFRYERGDTCPL